MYPMTRMRLDHLAHLLIATNRTQLHIRQPLPRRTLLLQIIQETFRAGHEWSILAVRAQTHVDAIQVAFARNARKCGNHELNQTRIRLVLRQRLDWRRHERVVGDEDVEIRAVVDTAAAKSS